MSKRTDERNTDSSHSEFSASAKSLYQVVIQELQGPLHEQVKWMNSLALQGPRGDLCLRSGADFLETSQLSTDVIFTAQLGEPPGSCITVAGPALVSGSGSNVRSFWICKMAQQ